MHIHILSYAYAFVSACTHTNILCTRSLDDCPSVSPQEHKTRFNIITIYYFINKSIYIIALVESYNS